jgi:hypothetical protein
MNAKVSARARTKAGQILKVVGVAAALMVGASSAAFAEPHGGFGGGGHFSGGGHLSAGGRGAVGHYAAPRYYGGYGGVRSYGYRGGGYAYGYRPGWGGGYWRGAFWPSAYYGWGYPFYLGVLPALYATYWWSGVPYYYVNNVYYTYSASDNGYVATDPPPVAAGDYSDDVNAAAAAGPDAAQNATPPDVSQSAAAAGAGLIAYPRNGQSDQQQSQDKFECHNWAKGQTGFDPTSQASSGAGPAVRSNYGRAMAACLDARGYTVR